MDREIEDVVIRARKRHPTWGPRKLRAGWVEPFRGQRPRLVLPAASTMGEVLKRHGLVRSRRRRRHTPPRTHPFSAVSAPNSVWCVDFKGHFRTQDGTKLGWMRLGISHERIDPGKPQQKGRHERMHLTLKQETASPPAADFMAQPRVFDWDDQQPHRVDKYGFAPWKRSRLFVGQALAQERVEFFPVKEKQWEVKYGPIVLGLFDEGRKHLGLIRPGRRQRRR